MFLSLVETLFLLLPFSIALEAIALESIALEAISFWKLVHIFSYLMLEAPSVGI